MISIGIGVSSGELIIWPYVTSQVGLVFLWAAVIGVLNLARTFADRVVHPLPSAVDGPGSGVVKGGFP